MQLTSMPEVQKAMQDQDEAGGFMNILRAMQSNPEWLKSVAERKDKKKQELMEYMGKWLSQANIKDDIQRACAIQLADEYGLDPRLGLLCVIEGRLYLDNNTLTYLHATRKEFQHLRFIGRLCTPQEIDFLRDKEGEPPAYAYCYECRTVQGGVDVLLGHDYGTVTKKESMATFKSGSPTVPNKHPRQMAMTRARVRCMKQFIVPIKEHNVQSFADVYEMADTDFVVTPQQELPPVRDSQTTQPQPVVKENLTPEREPMEPKTTVDKKAVIAKKIFDLLKQNIVELETVAGYVYTDDDLIISIDSYLEIKNRSYTTVTAIANDVQGFIKEFVILTATQQ